MAYVSKQTLLFITYLQLCRSELAGSWYSANVISDGDYSPKPISEIFSTAPNFSSTHPIIVLSSSTSSPTEDIISTYSTTPSTLPSSFATSAVSDGSSGIYSIPTENINRQEFPTLPFHTNDVITNQHMFRQKILQNQNSQQVPPNYFLNLPIYQQAPQNVQGIHYPSTQAVPVQSVSTQQSTVSTVSPETSSYLTSFSVSTVPPSSTLSTQAPEISSPQTTLSTIRPKGASTLKPRSSSSRSRTSKPARSATAKTTYAANCTNNTNVQNINPLAKLPALRVRVVSPMGSITNINVNSPPYTTTKRPTTTRKPKTTTTKRPRTTKKIRTKKNKNTYEMCINKCNVARKSPICAVPLHMNPIRYEKLKGFASICHMACHNSFRKDPYEMLINGRCGKLRTRIRTVDSDKKLSKGDLDKTQYTVEQTVEIN